MISDTPENYHFSVKYYLGKQCSILKKLLCSRRIMGLLIKQFLLQANLIASHILLINKTPKRNVPRVLNLENLTLK